MGEYRLWQARGAPCGGSGRGAVSATGFLPKDAAGCVFLSMVRPKGGASRWRTAAACPVLRRGREPAKGQVAWRGAALWWMPIHPNWKPADGSHQPRGALLTPVAGPPSSTFFTHEFCRGAFFPSGTAPNGNRHSQSGMDTEISRVAEPRARESRPLMDAPSMKR